MTRARILTIVMSGAVGAVFALAAVYSTVQAFHLGSRIDSLVGAETRNRASNVAVWCEAINAGRRYNQAFVTKVTHGRVRYRLAVLPCARLEQATRNSAK